MTDYCSVVTCVDSGWSLGRWAASTSSTRSDDDDIGAHGDGLHAFACPSWHARASSSSAFVRLTGTPSPSR